jgi:hypothetical protein
MPRQVTWTQRLARTQVIMSAAWQIIKEDKQLLLLPIASSLCLTALTATIVVPAAVGTLTGVLVAEDLRQPASLPYVGLFLFYVIASAIGIYFNAALACCVLRKFEGKSASIMDGLRGATACLPQILGWAVMATTIGLLLKIIERRSGFVGRLVVKVVGLAWGVATFLVVPVLAAEKKGPLDAVRESVQLLRKTWGDNLLAGLGFSLLYFLWAIPGLFAFLVGFGMIASHAMLALIIMVLAILYFPLLGLVLSTMSTIFDVVLYRFAKQGIVASGFNRDLLETSFITRSED